MGVYGGFEYGGDVYGPDVDIQEIELLTPSLVRMVLESPIRVDEDYGNTENYTIEGVEGSLGFLNIRSILLPTNSITTTEILIHTDKVFEGTIYRVTASNLTSVDEQSIVGEGFFEGRRTKAGNMIRALPQHFDKAPDSILSSLLIAIGRVDERIGGGLLEEIT